MKLNKTFGRIATTLVATAMLASVAAVPAFAVVDNGGVITGTDGGAIETITFNKTLRLPVDVTIPTVTFTFSLDAPTGTVSEDATDASSNQTIPVEAGTGNWDKTVSFSSGDENLAEDGTTTKTVTKEVSFDVPSFSAAGVYKYLLTEDALTEDTADFADFTQSDVTRAVYFFVENVVVEGQSKPVVTGAIISDSDSFATAAANKTDTIVNYYMLKGDPDNDDPDKEPDVKENDLTVTKTVTGDMGNKSEPFTFSIEIDGASGKTYNYTIDRTTGEDITDTLTSGRPNESITLAHGESIKITGLSATDTYTIIETDAADKGAMNADGYTTSYKVNGGQQQDSKTATGSLETSGDSTVSTTVAFTNNRNAVSPTGLIMDIAPYALLVVVAAAGCFVFLRKRRED